MNDLYRISGKHFVAGLEVNKNGVVVNCAPILRRWCANKHIDDVTKTCIKRGLDIEVITSKDYDFLSQFFIDDE